MGVSYYVIFDPERHLSDAMLRVFKRDGARFVQTPDDAWLPDLWDSEGNAIGVGQEA